MLPVDQAQGVSHFSECPSYSDVCTIWVRVPVEIGSAQLLYPGRDSAQLNVNLSLLNLSQRDVDDAWKPGDLHTFLSGGFTGFSLQISKKMAKHTIIRLGQAKQGTVYELQSLSKWLPAR